MILINVDLCTADLAEAVEGQENVTVRGQLDQEVQNTERTGS